MFTASVTTDPANLPDPGDGSFAPNRLGIRLADEIRRASTTVEIVLNPAETEELGKKITVEHILLGTIARLKPVFRDAEAGSWNNAERAAAFLVQCMLEACPKLSGVLDRPDCGDLIVDASTTFGINIEIGWPEDQHPLRSDAPKT